MKIAYIYPALDIYGGADRIITQKANYLADYYGHNVSIITAHQCGKVLSFPISDNVKHVDMNVNFSAQYGKPFLQRGLIYLKLINEYKKKLSHFLYSEKFDIICTSISRDVDFINDINDGSIKIAEAHVTKEYMRNLHLFDEKNILYRFVGKFFKFKLEKNLSKFDQVVVLTNADAKKWEPILTAKVIPNFVPIEIHKTSTCTNKKIISVGRLYPEKGYERLIEVWSIIANKYPDWSLSIYGEGELGEVLHKQIKEKGISNSFQINKPIKNIQDKYAESSIYVMTSRFEGFPLVLLEAMASNLPVVAFDCPEGPREIITNTSGGILVENNNIEEYVASLSQLIENNEYRVNMGNAASQSVKKYNRKVIMQQWVDLFEDLIRKKKHKPA